MHTLSLEPPGHIDHSFNSALYNDKKVYDIYMFSRDYNNHLLHHTIRLKLPVPLNQAFNVGCHVFIPGMYINYIWNDGSALGRCAFGFWPNNPAGIHLCHLGYL